MRSTNGHAPSETVLAAAHGSAARCLARALVVSFDACDDADIPLSQLQRAAILEVAFLEFDGFGLQLSSLETLGTLLRDARFAGPTDLPGA